MTINSLVLDQDVEKVDSDTLGGSYTKDTGLYRCAIDAAYLGKSKGGAMSLNIHFKLLDDNSVIRQTLWVTSGDAKGNKNYYIRNNKKYPLPGMALADQIAKITTGQPLGALSTEEKTLKLWDKDAGAEKNTQVPAITAMHGKPLLVALMKYRTNKMVSNGNGSYVPTPDERVFNEVEKVFFPNGYSVTEKEAGASEAKFHTQWVEKFGPDYVKDDFKANVEAPASDALPEVDSSSTEDIFGAA